MIKIVLDAMGGDNAPVETIAGAIKAINDNKDMHVVLSGKTELIQQELAKYKYDEAQISILEADEIITNDESPTMAIKTKKDSSLVKAFDLALNDNDVVGLVSAGSTGAVLTGGFLKFGRMKGIFRPALCPVMPTMDGGNVSICDCGANMDCKPEYLEQFAIMGSAYHKVLGKENPRVALLNVGTEDHKGDTRTKETFALLKENKNINFVGNMEARDALIGEYDVIVTDGFAGNVLLKSMEGTLKSFLKVLKSEIQSSVSSKFGYIFMRKTFKKIKKQFDYNQYGGAVLLGCKKLLVKAHGSSKSDSFAVCLNQVYNMHKGDLIGKITDALSTTGVVGNE